MKLLSSNPIIFLWNRSLSSSVKLSCYFTATFLVMIQELLPQHADIFASEKICLALFIYQSQKEILVSAPWRTLHRYQKIPLLLKTILKETLYCTFKCVFNPENKLSALIKSLKTFPAIICDAHQNLFGIQHGIIYAI